MVKYILLGLAQGLTEFFPVSSSGHLVIMQKLFGMAGKEVAISVILHLGTTLALVVFLFGDILKLLRDKKMLLLVMIVTIITGAIGLSAKDSLESLFSSFRLVAVALIVTGLILISTRRFMQARRDKLNLKDALVLGLAQGLAIIPGISRSGITISALLFRGLNSELSFKFSFLASIPAIFGAVILEARDMGQVLRGEWEGLVFGFVASFLTGLFALWALRLILDKAKLYYFGYYCIIVAIITLLFIK